MTLTTPRGPESTVVRMIANAMHIQNIEVETGWTPDEIKSVAVRNGFALDAASKRFRRAPRPKPAPPGIVRTSQTSTGAGQAPDPNGGAELQTAAPAAAPVLPETSGEEVVSCGPGEASQLRGTAFGASASSPEPDPFAAAGVAFADLLRAIALALNADPAIPVAHVAAPKPATSRPRLEKRAGESDGPTQADIRAWAKTQGLDVNPRGSIRRDIAEAYAAAHPGSTT